MMLESEIEYGMSCYNNRQGWNWLVVSQCAIGMMGINILQHHLGVIKRFLFLLACPECKDELFIIITIHLDNHGGVLPSVCLGWCRFCSLQECML